MRDPVAYRKIRNLSEEWRQIMNNPVEILDQGFACLVENLGVVNAEHFIALIKRDNFDYTVWQREYFACGN